MQAAPPACRCRVYPRRTTGGKRSAHDAGRVVNRCNRRRQRRLFVVVEVVLHGLTHSIRPGGPSLAAEVFRGLAKVPFYHMGKMEGIREPAAISDLGRS